MTGLAEITLVGILVADPELRIAPTGATVENFTVAANDLCYDPDSGEWVVKATTFLRCSAWCQAAGKIAGSLTKGTRVLVIGILRRREWENTDGDQRYAYEVDVTEVGASIAWATEKVTNTTRDATSGSVEH